VGVSIPSKKITSKSKEMLRQIPKAGTQKNNQLVALAEQKIYDLFKGVGKKNSSGNPSNDYSIGMLNEMVIPVAITESGSAEDDTLVPAVPET
jgi:hypothetical protein